MTIATSVSPSRQSLSFERFFTIVGVHPLDSLDWESRKAQLTDRRLGQTVFEQENVEFPSFWSQRASDIVSSKYFRGKLNTPEREYSLRQLIGRIAASIRIGALEQGYLGTETDAENFEQELIHLLVHQMAAFNSPVQFNLGVEKNPQCSACFISSVEDSLESIMRLASIEATIFKGGSGSGVNFSTIRSSKELISTGGFAAGPIQFLKGFDNFAAAIKSGGATRRAARMVLLNVDHPDIREFIWLKAVEEAKADALIGAGFSPEMDGEAYSSVSFQNANHSVQVTDAFLKKALAGEAWPLRAVTDGSILERAEADRLLEWMSKAAWTCGDPGLQFYDQINTWHTCPRSGPISACNPCSEYVFIDNSACNLASINLLKFLHRGRFQEKAFSRAVQTMILAQEVLVALSSYPTPRIRENSLQLRPLGLGYTNLGSTLMALGFPYDSAKARRFASAVTALLTGEAYSMSSRLARVKGAFDAYALNRDPMLEVIRRHQEASHNLESDPQTDHLTKSAQERWESVLRDGREHGFRNAQVTLLAPTGTISFMMDCDTTGIEPEYSLIKERQLAGGGHLLSTNSTLTESLAGLGYQTGEIQEILQYLKRERTLEGSPHLAPEHQDIYECAMPARDGKSIDYKGHLKMCSAVQPFLSGAISKTVNLPQTADAKQIGKIFIQAWEMGLKSISVYRDGCKAAQPLVQDSGQLRQVAEENGEKYEPGQLECAVCGHLSHRVGTCVICPTCGSSSGCS